MGIIETAKEAVTLVQKLDNIELVKTIMELQQQSYDLVLENRELKEDLAKVSHQLATQKQLRFANNSYWLDSDESEQSGPICSACWDARKLVVRMTRMHTGVARCNNCDKTVRYGPESPPRPHGIPRGPNWVRDY